jgi:tetratricopeptide (TPR) repeat protein
MARYAEQKLVETGEAEVARTRHRNWCLQLTELALDGMEGAEQKRWWARLEVEHDNLRAALRWSAAVPTESEALLRVAGVLGRFWQWRGFVLEGIDWLEIAVRRSPDTPSSARARALNWWAQLEIQNGNVERSRALLEKSIVAAREVGDGPVLSMALRHLGTGFFGTGDHLEASKLLDEALTISRQTDIKREIAWNLLSLAGNQTSLGELDRAEANLLASLEVRRQSDDLTATIAAFGALGRVYWLRGNPARAREQYEQALTLARELNMTWGTAVRHICLGDIALAEGDRLTAFTWYRL